MFFSVYMDDLSIVLNSSKVGCALNGVTINHLMYADDTCLLAPSPAALQHLLNLCSDFACNNSVVFNEGKTRLMCYRSRLQSNLQIPDIVLNGLKISVVDEHKYLRIVLQSDQKDESDMKRQIRCIYTRGNMLISRFKNCSVNVKNCLFRTYCTNVYGGQLWFNYRKPMYQKVKVAYNDVYRKLFGIPRGESISTIFVKNNVNTFCMLRRKLMYSFKCRLSTSENQLIRTVTESDDFITSPVYAEWQRTLYV